MDIHEHAARVQGIKDAIEHLKSARDLLRYWGANRAADAVARSLKSAEGAQRHAYRMQSEAAEVQR